MSENHSPKEFVPYEQSHPLRQLLFVTTIVPDGQSEFVLQAATRNEAALNLVFHGKGTAPKDVLLAATLSEKKEVIVSILREDRWPVFQKTLQERFSVSKMAKGIAYAVPIDSVAGVSIYKFLSNTRLFEHPMKVGKKQ